MNEDSSDSIDLDTALRLLHDLGFALRAHDAHRTLVARDGENLPAPFAAEVFRGLAIDIHGVEHVPPTLWLRDAASHFWFSFSRAAMFLE